MANFPLLTTTTTTSTATAAAASPATTTIIKNELKTAIARHRHLITVVVEAILQWGSAMLIDD